MQEIREEIDRIKSALVKHLPFCSSLIRKSRIRLATLPPYSAGAGVDRDGVIWIDPEKWAGIPFEEKAFILAHEALHVATYTAQRSKDDRFLWNVASDIVINRALRELPLPAPRNLVQGEDLEARGILPKGWERMSTEEVYEHLEHHTRRIIMEVAGDKSPGRDLLGSDFRAPEDAPTVQEGDKEIYEAPKGDRERLWKEALAQATMAQKMAGNLPEGLERWVDGFVRPKLSIRGLLHYFIREGLGRVWVNSWHRPSRRHPDLPWYRRFTTPHIWALVDTSGSIDEQELALFVGTLYEFVSRTKVQVTCWDAEAYETIQAGSQGELLRKLKKAMKGGGGTVIAPALRKTLERMRPQDVVVVLSDGYIYDWDEAETRALLRKVASRAAKAIFLTTGEEKGHPGWITLRLA
ncbi:MAG: VWA domain-containing protein [Candidatus Hadarchaeales archaeon]